MNICFLIGKICSKIEFEFILNSKDISVAMFDIELLDKSVIKVKCYNKIADYCYSSLKTNMIITLEGSINSKMEVIIKNIYYSKLRYNFE